MKTRNPKSEGVKSSFSIQNDYALAQMIQSGEEEINAKAQRRKGAKRPSRNQKSLECGDMSPLSDDATCRVEPKRGHVHALQKSLQRATRLGDSTAKRPSRNQIVLDCGGRAQRRHRFSTADRASKAAWRFASHRSPKSSRRAMVLTDGTAKRMKPDQFCSFNSDLGRPASRLFFLCVFASLRLCVKTSLNTCNSGQRAFRTSDFGFLSSFVIRHSGF